MKTAEWLEIILSAEDSPEGLKVVLLKYREMLIAERDQEWRDKIEEKIKEYEGEIKRPMTDDIKTLYKYQIQALTELLEEK